MAATHTTTNNNRVVSGISAIALIWIFWPIVSPTLLILQTIVFLPVSILAFLLGTFGEMMLFTASLGAFVWFTRDSFVRLVGEQHFNDEIRREIDDKRETEEEYASRHEETAVAEHEEESQDNRETEEKYAPSNEITAEVEQEEESRANKQPDAEHEYQIEEQVELKIISETSDVLVSNELELSKDFELSKDLELSKVLATQNVLDNLVDVAGVETEFQEEKAVAPSAC